MAAGRASPKALRYEPAMAWSPDPRALTLSLPEQIAQSVGNAIIDGKYEAGTRILEKQLADDFEVSRGPVREALRILEREGLVQLQARRGAQVVQFDPEELRQIFQVRASLLALAARLATELQEEEFIADLKRRVEGVAKLARREEDAKEYVIAASQLNLSLAAGSGNKYLANIVFSLANQTLRYTRLGLATKARRLQSSKNWLRLLQAIEGKDADTAASVAESLVVESRDAALSLIDRQNRKFADQPPS
jgi:DNA-binding GntR family transcriptional regulator